MKKVIIVALLILWAAFLVCIATFGGPEGHKVAGTATFMSIAMLFIFGDQLFDDDRP